MPLGSRREGIAINVKWQRSIFLVIEHEHLFKLLVLLGLPRLLLHRDLDHPSFHLRYVVIDEFVAQVHSLQAMLLHRQ